MRVLSRGNFAPLIIKDYENKQKSICSSCVSGSKPTMCNGTGEHRFFGIHQRLSVGASMASEGFCLKPDVDVLPEVCYYSEAVIKPEVCYEYIINRHFYLWTCVGVSAPIKAGIYTKSRKGIDENGQDNGSEPIVKQDRKAQPFLSFGVSYSIFK
ncbi:MAG: hypothetical protein ACI308_07530 [Muribaculaceae bacterium]